MDLIYILLPFCLLLASVSVGLFIWAVRSGQFEDMTTPAIRMLFDDDEPKKPAAKEPNVKKTVKPAERK
jgi:cbb3-type cytochrome oxidase maturation protein